MANSEFMYDSVEFYDSDIEYWEGRRFLRKRPSKVLDQRIADLKDERTRFMQTTVT